MTLIDSLHGAVESLGRWPIAKDVVHRQALERFKNNQQENLFYGIHGSWAEAEAAAQALGRTGYDNPESSSLYQYMMHIAPHDYPALYWISRSLSEGMKSVFDVGGSIGIKFYAFKEHLSPWRDLRWRVQDVPSAAELGTALAADRGASNQLDFSSDFYSGDGFDLMFASGVVQYLPQRLGEMLSSYKQLPKRIVVNTAAIHGQHEFFTVNSIGTAFCPYRVQTQAGFVRALSSMGYRVRETWKNPGKPMIIPLHPEHSISEYSGYCLDLVKTA